MPTVQTRWGEWNTEQYRTLKREYVKAIETNQDEFKIGEAEFVTSFAGYLIQFLESEGIDK